MSEALALAKVVVVLSVIRRAVEDGPSGPVVVERSLDIGLNAYDREVRPYPNEDEAAFERRIASLMEDQGIRLVGRIRWLRPNERILPGGGNYIDSTTSGGTVELPLTDEPDSLPKVAKVAKALKDAFPLKGLDGAVFAWDAPVAPVDTSSLF